MASKGEQLPITSFFGNRSLRKRKSDLVEDGGRRSTPRKRLKQKENVTASAADANVEGNNSDDSEKPPFTASPSQPLSPRRSRISPKPNMYSSAAPSLTIRSPQRRKKREVHSNKSTPVHSKVSRVRALMDAALPTPPPTIPKRLATSATEYHSPVSRPSLPAQTTTTPTVNNEPEPQLLTPRSPIRQPTFALDVSTPLRATVFDSPSSQRYADFQFTSPIRGSPKASCSGSSSVVPSSQTFRMDSQAQFMSLTDALVQAKETVKDKLHAPSRQYTPRPDVQTQSSDSGLMVVPSSQTQEIDFLVPEIPRHATLLTGTDVVIERKGSVPSSQSLHRPPCRHSGSGFASSRTSSESDSQFFVPSSQSQEREIQLPRESTYVRPSDTFSDQVLTHVYTGVLG